MVTTLAEMVGCDCWMPLPGGMERGQDGALNQRGVLAWETS